MQARYVGYKLALFLLLFATPCFAQGRVLNTSHPMARNLLTWLVVLPQTAGGTQWYSLVGPWHGVLQNMQTSTLGLQPSSRPGYIGEMRFDGTSSAIAFGTDAYYEFSNRTITFAIRWRSPADTGSSQYLIGRRYTTGTPAFGGYLIRINTGSGALNARISDSANGNVVNITTTATTGYNGQVHTVVAVFKFDTTTAANNSITVYYDGKLDTSGTGSGNPYSACPSCPFNLGSASDDPETASLGGAILEYRLYDGALNAAQAQIFHQQEGPSFGGLLYNRPLVGMIPTLPVKHKAIIQ